MRSEAAWNRLCAELGRVYGEMVAAQERASEHERTIEELQRQLARQQDAMQQEGGQ